MLLFRSEEALNAWCAARGQGHGEILDLDQLWRLAQLWYHNRLDHDFRGRSTAQAEAVFAEAGLTSAFWRAQPG